MTSITKFYCFSKYSPHFCVRLNQFSKHFQSILIRHLKNVRFEYTASSDDENRCPPNLFFDLWNKKHHWMSNQDDQIDCSKSHLFNQCMRARIVVTDLFLLVGLPYFSKNFRQTNGCVSFRTNCFRFFYKWTVDTCLVFLKYPAIITSLYTRNLSWIWLILKEPYSDTRIPHFWIVALG